MEGNSEWRAKLASACYLALIGGILGASFVTGFIFLGLDIKNEQDFINLDYPAALVSLPINELIILGVTLLFARYKGASLKDLGLKKASVKTLAMVSAVAVPLFLAGAAVSIGEEMIFGPDPMGEILEVYVMPRSTVQLVALILLSLILVGPCEELGFRGFVQKGFENSFGKVKGLLIGSVLFGLLHGLNTLYAVLPALVGGLVLGYVWQRTGGNTTASALLHGLNNSISLVLAYLLAG